MEIVSMSFSLGRKVVLGALASSALLVAGCATETTYRPATGQGFYRTGFSERQVEPGRFLVSFAGNSSTSRDTVERYLFFRAAELTLQQGYDYFVIAAPMPRPASAVAGAMVALVAIGVRPGAIMAVASAASAIVAGLAAWAGAHGMVAALAASMTSTFRPSTGSRQMPRS
jgi:hypothetical protein